MTDDEKALRHVVNSSEPWAHINDMTGIEQYFYSIERCDWRIIPETFFPSGYAIALPTGSPYETIISKE